MTKSFFIAKLTRQFDKINPDVLADIGDYVATFSDESIGRLWDAFELNHLLVSPPKKGHLVKIARAANINPIQPSEPLVKYESICYLCAAHGNPYRYPVEAHGCPQCGNLFWSWTGVGRAGVQVSAERAQGIIAAYPKGPHPTLSNTPEAKAFRNSQRLHGAIPLTDQASNHEVAR